MGLYTTPPGPMMALDIDGSAVNTLNIGAGTQASATMATIMDEDSDAITVSSTQGQTVGFAIIFPELRDVVAYKLVRTITGTGSANGNVEWSANTTNGIDGSWTSLGAVTYTTTISKPDIRDGITTLSQAGVKALRFRSSTGSSGGQSHQVQMLHLYGTYASGENLQRLAPWHPTLDQALTGTEFDWEEKPSTSSTDKTFRLKNMHGSLTANGTVVTTGTRTAVSPTLQSQTTFERTVSNPGVFATSVTLPSISPGAISEVITVRLSLSAAALGLAWWYTRATPASWT